MGCTSSEELAPDARFQPKKAGSLRFANRTSREVFVRFKGQIADTEIKPNGSSTAVRFPAGKTALSFGSKASDEQTGSLEIAEDTETLFVLTESSSGLSGVETAISPADKGVDQPLQVVALPGTELQVFSTVEGKAVPQDLGKTLQVRDTGMTLEVVSGTERARIEVPSIKGSKRVLVVTRASNKLRYAVVRQDSAMEASAAGNSK